MQSSFFASSPGARIYGTMTDCRRIFGDYTTERLSLAKLRSLRLFRIIFIPLGERRRHCPSCSTLVDALLGRPSAPNGLLDRMRLITLKY